MKGLTPTQLNILNFIQQFIEKNHYSPNYREIMRHFDFHSTGSVYKHVRTLKRKGVLTSEKGSHRSLMPIHSPIIEKENKDIQLPLVGNISVGYPLELFIQPQMISVPLSLVYSPENTYILQTRGEALQEECIRDGDLLLIEARQEIQPGEIILGLINQHDTVLKRYFPEGQNMRLESQHHQIPSLTVRNEHILIQGVLIGLVRIF